MLSKLSTGKSIEPKKAAVIAAAFLYAIDNLLDSGYFWGD